MGGGTSNVRHDTPRSGWGAPAQAPKAPDAGPDHETEEPAGHSVQADAEADTSGKKTADTEKTKSKPTNSDGPKKDSTSHIKPEKRQDPSPVSGNDGDSGSVHDPAAVSVNRGDSVGPVSALSASDLFKEAVSAEQDDDTETARVKYQQAAEKAESDGKRKLQAMALSGAARALFHLTRYEEAAETLKQSIALYRELKNARARSLDYMLAGKALMALDKLGSALSAFEEAQKLLPRSEADKRPELIRHTAVCLARLNRYHDAQAAYSRLVNLLKRAGKEKQAAEAYIQLGELQLFRSAYDYASANFDQAYKIALKHKDNKTAATALFGRACVEHAVGDRKAAQGSISEAQKLYDERSSAEHPLQGLALGMSSYYVGNMVQAVTKLRDIVVHYDRIGDRAATARAQLCLAQVESGRSRLKAAMQLAGKALREYRKLADAPGEAAALTLIGQVYFYQGYLQKALEYAQESLAIARRSGARVEETRAGILAARLYYVLGDTDFAWKLLREGLEGARRNDRESRAIIRLTMAEFRMAREAAAGAMEDLEAARKAFQANGDKRGLGDCDLRQGRIHEIRGEREQAVALFSSALNRYRKIWDRYREAKVLTALGVHYKNVGSHKKARGLFTKALEIQTGIGDRRGVAANLANLGNLLNHKHDVQAATEKLDKALEIYRELADRKGEADILTNLGNVHAAAGTTTVALEKYNAALELHKQIQDTRGAATDLAGIGRLYLIKGDLDNAAYFLDEAARVNARINNPAGEIVILADAAMLERARGNSTGALTRLKKAVKLAERTKDSRAASSLQLKMAMVMQDLGKNEEALALLKRSMDTIKRHGDKSAEVQACGEIGITLLRMREYEQAMKYLRTAIELRDERGLSAVRTRNLEFHLGKLYEGFKNYEAALEYYRKALAVAQLSVNDSQTGEIYHRIGSIQYQLEDYAKAKELFEDALRVHTEIRDITMQQNELVMIGDLLSRLGNPESALDYQKRALALTQEQGDSRNEAKVLTRMGTLQQKLGRPRYALEHFRQALEIRTRLGDRRGMNENLLQIALLAAIRGQFDDAFPVLRRAYQIAQSSKDRRMLWKAFFIIGRTYQGKGRYGDALESYRSAMLELEKMEEVSADESEEDSFIFGGKTALYETTLSLLMKLARKDPDGAYDAQALQIVEKLKAAELEKLLSGINVESFSDVPKEALIREKSLRLSLRQINSRLDEELSKVRPDRELVKQLLKERRKKEKAFRKLKAFFEREAPSYAALRYPGPVVVSRLQRETVDPEEAVLEYMVTRSRTYVFAIDKNRFHTYSVEYPAKELARDVASIIGPLRGNERPPNWDPSIAYRVYSKLVEPLEYFLIGKKTVVVVPHGPLTSLPFEVLVTSKKHAKKQYWEASDRPSFLVEKYPLCYVPSAAMLTFLRKRPTKAEPGWNLAAFGDALYSVENDRLTMNSGAERILSSFDMVSDHRGGLPTLKKTRDEIVEVAKVLGDPAQLYTGGQVTESLLKKADLSRYGYIHLGAHWIVSDDAGKLSRQPAVVLSLFGDPYNDGFLQLGEVFGLQLNSELITLSSCLTPKTESPGLVNGLQPMSNAFLYSGAGSVLVGMRPENDVGRALFLEMYKQLRTQSKAQALQQARLKILSAGRTNHPYYWGPYILAGKWKVAHRPKSGPTDLTKIRFKGLSMWRRLLSL